MEVALVQGKNSAYTLRFGWRLARLLKRPVSEWGLVCAISGKNGEFPVALHLLNACSGAA